MSKTTNTHNESSEDELMTELLTSLPSTMMSEHSPVSHENIAELRMYLLQDFRASHSASHPKREKLVMTNEICGQPQSKLLERLSQKFVFSKMCVDFCRLEQGEWRIIQGDLFHPTSAPFSGTWPTQGTMRDGVCWEQTMSVAGIKGNASGSDVSYPTPTAQRPSLQQIARHNLWPTVTAQDNNQVRGEGAAAGKKDRSTTLGGAVRKWPTPSSRDWKGGRQFDTLEGKGRNSNNTLPDAINAAAGEVAGLNPDWAEALMGWPIGWTRQQNLVLLWDFAWLDWEMPIPRTMKKCRNRVKRITAIGNGQVPLTMAVAYKLLEKET